MGRSGRSAGGLQRAGGGGNGHFGTGPSQQVDRRDSLDFLEAVGHDDKGSSLHGDFSLEAGSESANERMALK